MSPQQHEPGESRFATERDPRLRILIPGVVAMAFLMEQLDATIITTAIPDMAHSLGTTAIQLNVAITAYVLTVAAFIPLSGWLADRFGARRIFISALVVFTVGSVLCGMADSLPMLVATRILQGLGGAMMTPVGRLILLSSFPRREMVTAMMYMSLPALVGPMLGPLLGGVLTTYLSWRWIFYANVPFGLIGIALAAWCLEPGRGDPKRSFDVRGFLLIGSGVALLQFCIENITHPLIPVAANVGVGVVAALLLASFVRHARRAAEPVVDLSLFRLRSFAVGTLVGGLCRIAINGFPFLLPLMLQIGFGMSPVASGTLTFLGSAGIILTRPLLSRLLRHFGFRRVLISSALGSSALMVACSAIWADTPSWLLVAYIFAFGVVRSIQFLSSNTLAYSDTPDDKLSRATALGGILQQLTVSFGITFAATLLGLISGHGAVLTPEHFHQVFLVSAILPLLTIPGFLLLRHEDGSRVSGYGTARPTDEV